MKTFELIEPKKYTCHYCGTKDLDRVVKLEIACFICQSCAKKLAAAFDDTTKIAKYAYRYSAGRCAGTLDTARFDTREECAAEAKRHDHAAPYYGPRVVVGLTGTGKVIELT